jgi:hypothetical protein
VAFVVVAVVDILAPVVDIIVKGILWEPVLTLAAATLALFSFKFGRVWAETQDGIGKGIIFSCCPYVGQ